MGKGKYAGKYEKEGRITRYRMVVVGNNGERYFKNVDAHSDNEAFKIADKGNETPIRDTIVAEQKFNTIVSANNLTENSSKERFEEVFSKYDSDGNKKDNKKRKKES